MGKYDPCSHLPPVPGGSLWRVSGDHGGVIIRRAPHVNSEYPHPPGEENYRVYDPYEIFLVVGEEPDWTFSDVRHVKVMTRWGPMFVHRGDFSPSSGKTDSVMELVAEKQVV